MADKQIRLDPDDVDFISIGCTQCGSELHFAAQSTRRETGETVGKMISQDCGATFGAPRKAIDSVKDALSALKKFGGALI